MQIIQIFKNHELLKLLISYLKYYFLSIYKICKIIQYYSIKKSYKKCQNLFDNFSLIYKKIKAICLDLNNIFFTRILNFKCLECLFVFFLFFVDFIFFSLIEFCNFCHWHIFFKHSFTFTVYITKFLNGF